MHSRGNSPMRTNSGWLEPSADMVGQKGLARIAIGAVRWIDKILRKIAEPLTILAFRTTLRRNMACSGNDRVRDPKHVLDVLPCEHKVDLPRSRYSRT